MIPSLADELQALALQEPVRSHARALLKRAIEEGSLEVQRTESSILLAGLEYLASRVEEPEVTVRSIVDRRQVSAVHVLPLLGPLRASMRYREYVGEWIRGEISVGVDESEDAIVEGLAEGTYEAESASARSVSERESRDDVHPSASTSDTLRRVRTSLLAQHKRRNSVPAPSSKRSIASRTRGFIDRLIGVPRGSWTGTPGSRSYYDKDSSPD